MTAPTTRVSFSQKRPWWTMTICAPASAARSKSSREADTPQADLANLGRSYDLEAHGAVIWVCGRVEEVICEGDDFVPRSHGPNLAARSLTSVSGGVRVEPHFSPGPRPEAGTYGCHRVGFSGTPDVCRPRPRLGSLSDHASAGPAPPAPRVAGAARTGGRGRWKRRAQRFAAPRTRPVACDCRPTVSALRPGWEAGRSRGLPRPPGATRPLGHRLRFLRPDRPGAGAAPG